MTSRQVQWRRFTFFDKDTIAEDVKQELGGAEVTCMHTASGRLYLGDDRGRVTVSDCHLGGRIQRQAYTGPVFALGVAPEGLPIGSGAVKSQRTPSNGNVSGKRKSGVVVTLGDDSVVPAPSLASFQSGTAAQTAGGVSMGSSGVGTGGGMTATARSPFVLKFWAGVDMMVCVSTVDVATQMGDPAQPPQQRWASDSAGLSRLTAFAITPDALQVACGFADGTALLLQNDLTRGPHQSPPAPLLIQPGEDNPSAVTALHFSMGQGGSGSPQVKLLVGYDLDDTKHGPNGRGMPAPGPLGLLSYDTRSDAEPLVLDELGCKEGCSAFGQSTQEMVVGRNDGVYFFSAEDRGGAAGFEGTKQHVGCLWNYIMVVSQDSRSARHTVNIYDMRNKLVAFHVLLPQGQAVKRIACQGERNDAPVSVGAGDAVGGSSGGGALAFVLTDRNSLIRLRERGTPSKLELLFRKNLYPMAISLAYASDHDVSEILGIYRMYGDHLYKKGDFEGAMQQYKSTIGHLDPSYVIRRFLDAQRIGLLTSYLEALHDAGQASSDHTTLLLNCHTKLKDVEKLDRFIHPGEPPARSPNSAGGGDGHTSTVRQTQGGAGGGGSMGSSGGAGGTLSANFDVVTAIRVLKSAGHADHAAELARRHCEHDWFLRIQLERAQPDFQGALGYIASLSFDEASEQLRRRGKPLVAALPEDTTGVLMALCTGRYSRKTGQGGASRGRESVGRGGARISGQNSNNSDSGSIPLPSSSHNSSKRTMAAAEDFVHLYVDEPKWLRIFLTYVLREGGQAGPAVADTLLELLLREWARETSSDGSGGGGDDSYGAAAKQREGEILALLDNPRAGYDADHALVLVQMLNFRPGQLYLYEKLYMTDLVLEHYVDTGDTRNMIRVCRKEGNNNPDVWVQVLTHLVKNACPRPSEDATKSSPPGDNNASASSSSSRSKNDGDGDSGGLTSDDEGTEGRGVGGDGVWDDVRELLSIIERDQMLAPLQVLTILSQNPSLPLWVTRDFLPRYLAGAATCANSDASAAAELRESTRKMRSEIQSLRATVQSSSGAGSRLAMELPTFFGAEDVKGGGSKLASPLGIPPRVGAGAGEVGGMGGEQAKIQDIKAAQARSAVDHEQFFKGLEEAPDGFAQVASYFGKGVLS